MRGGKLSVAALTIVFVAKLGKSSTKSVLVALADRADDVTGICFPSVRDIVERTELDRKTVLTCLKELEHRKFLQDTGGRCGKTKQVKVWYIDLELIQASSIKSSQKRNGSMFPSKQSPFLQKTVPKTGHGTTKGPSFDYHHINRTKVSGNSKRLSQSKYAWQMGDLQGDMDEFISSACWMQNRTKGIWNPAGFQIDLTARLARYGPTQRDWETFKLWRASQPKSVATEISEGSRYADERRRWLADAKERYAVMEEAQQQELKFQFASHLSATNSFAHNAYQKSGLDSSVVAGAFHEWLVGKLL